MLYPSHLSTLACNLRQRGLGPDFVSPFLGKCSELLFHSERVVLRGQRLGVFDGHNCHLAVGLERCGFVQHYMLPVKVTFERFHLANVTVQAKVFKPRFLCDGKLIEDRGADCREG